MKSNKRIITVMVSVCSLFLITVVYLTYFTLFQAKDIIKSSANQRIWEKEEKVLRGSVYDRSGVLLAESKQTEKGQKRIYPYGSLYTHTIGYNSRTYGKTNIELKFNDYLLKTESVIDVLKRDSRDEDAFRNGAKLELTLDHGMTELAQKLMAGSNGSIAALNPATGEVYCMYSNPTFDPNESSLTKEWNELSQSESSPFLARATQGLYAPGSTFKVITAAAGIESGYEAFTFNDQGKVKIGGKEFKNSGSSRHGKIGMSDAVKVSSNVYFASLSQKIGSERLGKAVDAFGVTKKIPFDISTKAVSLDFSSMSDVDLASASIGQGKLLVTPLHMALTACAVANGGVIMQPYMVSRAYFDDGATVYNARQKVLSEAMDSETAEKIGEYMTACVKSGTGRAANVRGITVAGKTGTAENERKGKTHAWFICYAPAENPQIAICVMKEYSGRGGGSACAPAAAKLISYGIEHGLISAENN